MLPELPTPLHSPGVCVTSGKLFIFGGDLRGIPSKECDPPRECTRVQVKAGEECVRHCFKLEEEDGVKHILQ